MSEILSKVGDAVKAVVKASAEVVTSAAKEIVKSSASTIEDVASETTKSPSSTPAPDNTKEISR